MDSRRIFQFDFVNRYQPKGVLSKFIREPSETNVLWLSGVHGLGKTRLIEQVLLDCLLDKQIAINCSFKNSAQSDELAYFLNVLQAEASLSFLDFLKANYTSLFDVSKQITTQILKAAGVDLSGFISAAYDGSKMFVTYAKQQQAAVKVIATYIESLLKQKRVVLVFDHLSSCKRPAIALFVQVIGQFVEQPNIRFIICTTDEAMTEKNDIVANLLSKISVISLNLKPFDEDIYFYEILSEIFELPQGNEAVISQIYTLCNGSPSELQAALIELYRTNIIQLGEPKASLDWNRLKRFLLQSGLKFECKNYSFHAQLLLRLIVALDEQVPAKLLVDAGGYIVERLFQVEMPESDFQKEVFHLYQLNLIDTDVENNNAVKISNPIVREALKEQYRSDPAYRLFSNTLVNYFADRQLPYLNPEWKKYIVVLHSIEGLAPGWVQTALDYGIDRYHNGANSQAAELFAKLQGEFSSISSKDLLVIADCFYRSGRYNIAESALQTIQIRKDLFTWSFYYCYSIILNLQLKKEKALEAVKLARTCAQNDEEEIKALNMQQQILVDTAGGKAQAKEIFDQLVRRLKHTSEESRRFILPTLKAAIDFYHGEASFKYLLLAKEIASSDDNQLEEAFIFTNLGYEYYRQGKDEKAESSFHKSMNMLTNIRIHETSYPLCNLANCYIAQGKYEDAISALLRAGIWNQSGYTFLTIQTLLMVCYSFVGKGSKSTRIVNDLISYIGQYQITDTTILRKIYLNIALTYRRLGDTALEQEYAIKAYPLCQGTSSWYRAYQAAMPVMQNLSFSMDRCPEGETTYWTAGEFEPWLLTFSHD